ncbi:MAG: hypothetical protein KDJ43_04565 [Rhizobiaceae bacterium]|nr:hypothetical protein [Rhizobiaceae bacterium]
MIGMLSHPTLHALAAIFLLSPVTAVAQSTEQGLRMQRLFMDTCFEATEASDMTVAARAAMQKGYKLLGTIHPTGSKRKGYKVYGKAKGQEEIWIGATAATAQSCGVTFNDSKGPVIKDKPPFLHTVSMATKGKPWGKGFITTHWVTHSFNGVRYEYAIVPGKDRVGYFANFK